MSICCHLERYARYVVAKTDMFCPVSSIFPCSCCEVPFLTLVYTCHASPAIVKTKPVHQVLALWDAYAEYMY